MTLTHLGMSELQRKETLAWSTASYSGSRAPLNEPEPGSNSPQAPPLPNGPEHFPVFRLSYLLWSPFWSKDILKTSL